MSNSPKRDDNGDGSVHDGGILANLPRTRPQRSSRRRAVARDERAPTRSAASSRSLAPGERSAQRRRAAPRQSSVPRPDSVPRQGFESEGDEVRGAVQPPGPAELVTAAGEIAGELAKVGLSVGRRLLKGAVARL